MKQNVYNYRTSLNWLVRQTKDGALPRIFTDLVLCSSIVHPVDLQMTSNSAVEVEVLDAGFIPQFCVD